tara:strand:- start:92 stop:520 length:429 start_codon:yes stop_codon:yes gene_type:complete
MSSSVVFNDHELGDAFHFVSITGLLLLFVGCVLFFVFYFGYHEAKDNETTTTPTNVTKSQETLEISWIVTASLGYLLCFAIVIAHHYKSKNDPKTVVGFNHVFHEMGENLVKIETKLEDNDYNASSGGSIGSHRVQMSGDFL